MNNRKNIYILSFTMLVVMLGYGLIIPILPFYVERLGAGGTELGLLAASYAIMRLICGPFMGTLSDRVGRKPVLMIGIFGYALTMLLFGLATQLWMLFVFRILSGVLSSATSPTTMAYIGDSTADAERSRGMGFLGAAMGLGTILGPVIGGFLAGESIATPFFVASGFSFAALALIYFFLPESLPAEARQPKRVLKQNRLETLRQAILSPVGPLLGLSFLVAFAAMAFFSIFGLYALEKFGSGPQAVGSILAVMGLITTAVQGGLVGPLNQRWGERRLIPVALLAAAIGFIAIALASNFSLFLAAAGWFALATGLLSPMVMSLVSQHAGAAQGEKMGLNDAFINLGRIAGPLLFGVAFDVNIEFPMYAGGAVLLAGFLASVFWLRRSQAALTSV